MNNVFSKLKIKYSKIELSLEILSIVAILLYVYFWRQYWEQIPAKIPTHYNFWGTPDIWSDKGYLPSIFYVVLFIYFLLTIVSRFPNIINFPIKITPENEKRQYNIRFSLICWIKAELVIIICLLGLQSLRVSMGVAESIGQYSLLLSLIIIFFTLGLFVFRASKSQ